MMDIGEKIYNLCVELFPINRSLMGSGVEKTLNILKRENPRIEIKRIPTGTKCLDWEVPGEWIINDGFLKDPDGIKIVDYKKNNLQVITYSSPIDKKISLADLKKNLFTLPNFPEAIPYITSYYNENWGFCLSENQKLKLRDGIYHAFIDSEIKPGNLSYGELFIPGSTKKEVFFSTYVCHPSLANDNISGASLATFLAKFVQNISNRKYSYRFIFIPETIGSIAYVSKNFKSMKKNIIAGFNLTCVGDDDKYSFLPSRNGNSLADKVALHVLKNNNLPFSYHSFLERGSDERQYCSPGLDLPFCSVMRSKYGEFKEYHTSFDNLDYVSKEGFEGSYRVHLKIIDILENNSRYKVNVLCEPQLGKRNLYPPISTHDSFALVKDIKNVIAYSDGKLDLIDLSEKINLPAWKVIPILKKLIHAKLIKY